MYNGAMIFLRRLLLVAPIAFVLCAEDASLPVVNGKPVTKAELDAILKLAPAELQAALSKDPRALLEYYGMVDRVSEMAEKAGLSEQSPIKEQLVLARKQILTNAAYERYFKDHPTTPEDEAKFYAEHLDDYTSALVKVIYLPVNRTGEESAAKAKAEALVKQLGMGAAFDELAEKYPLAGFPNVIKKSDTSIPQAIRAAVFAVKKGGVTNPVVLPNGVYLVQMHDLSVKPLNDVRGDVADRLLNDRFSAWVAEIRKSVTVETTPAK
jgi:parvulin-like peptidyl-prolyl isomerase